jgi:hypothetical protein
MRAPHERPWPVIDLAEVRCCLAFGSSVEDKADFLRRDVEDVRRKIAIKAQPSRRREREACGRIRIPLAGIGVGKVGDDERR